MKVGVYINDTKDTNSFSKNFFEILQRENIEYVDVKKNNDGDLDAIFVLGGDGTILSLTEFAVNNSISIIGINAGKLGFLTEFETYEAEEAVRGLKENSLIKDERTVLSVNIGGKKYFALNDVVLQRMLVENNSAIVVSIAVSIDGNSVDKIGGDGVIVSTPTGSTAYSLSAGGPILAPGIEALAVTPISAHSLHNRPIICSSSSVVTLKTITDVNCGIFLDGKFIGKIAQGEEIKVTKAEKKIVFLRKKSSNFFKRLVSKLNYKDSTL